VTIDVSARSPLDLADLRDRVHDALAAFLARRRAQLVAVDPALEQVAESIECFVLGGGKRLRPAFAYWGYRGAGGADCDEVIAATGALELVHASALIHDDVMDASDTRRGLPSVHRHFADLHDRAGWCGDPAQFGRASAILLGDLCLVWSDALLHDCGLPAAAIARARPVFDEMRTEVTIGQYLDVHAQVSRDTSVLRAGLVARYKSAKYTVERPLLLGAELAGATEPIRDAYRGYGLPLGEAFQLRDDILGVFGDPAQTGKPAGDDLREGKRTVLVALTLERATTAQTETVEALLGDPALDLAGVELLRSIIVETGALDACEKMIDRYTADAEAALAAAPLVAEGRRALSELTVVATARTV
jgi:geranylgeranyl diphosphate synthase type I